MKLIVFFSFLLTVLVLCLPFFIIPVNAGIELDPANPDPDSLSGTLSASESENGTPELPPASSRANPNGPDASFEVRLLTGGEVVTLNAHDYLVGVVAAEMPATFYPEALKAQAVAARTFTLYKILKGSKGHPQADVCDDISCCKAYLSPENLSERWGNKYSFNIYIMENAVTDTDGIYLSYGGEPIFAAFHSSSPGYTEDCGNVFSSPLPYLISVESPETENTVPNFNSELQVSFENFKYTVLASYPEASFGGEPDSWLSDAVYSDSGRILHLSAGSVQLTGTEFRSLFGLRSASVTWQVEGDGFRFFVVGYGHGVGMSQYGANEFAKNGASFEDILSYYYQGAELANYDVQGAIRRSGAYRVEVQ